jgi:hypothetical protein
MFLLSSISTLHQLAWEKGFDDVVVLSVKETQIDYGSIFYHTAYFVKLDSGK